MFPHACSVPELRLTHRARISVYNSQNPRQPLSLVSARQIGYPPQRAGAQLELLRAGCAQMSGGQLVFVSPRARGPCRRPCGCCLSALTPAGAVQLGDSPAGWSGGGRGTGWPGSAVAFSNINRPLHRKYPALMKEWGSSNMSAELKKRCSSVVSPTEMKKAVWGSVQQ